MSISDDASSISEHSNVVKRIPRVERKTIHPSRYAHILELRTKDVDSNTITVCSIQDYRNSGAYDSEETHSSIGNYLVSYPDDDSDLCSSLVCESVRNSIYSVKSGQDFDEVYALIDSQLCSTLSDINASVESLTKGKLKIDDAVDDDDDDDDGGVVENENVVGEKCTDENENFVNVQCPLVFLDTGRAASVQRDLKWSGYKKVLITRRIHF